MKRLLEDIKQCTICKAHLPLGPRPVVSAHKDSKIVIVGQAPGTKVHNSGVPWDDASGKQLRQWLQVTEAQFYNPENFAIIPYGILLPWKGNKWRFTPTTRMRAAMARAAI